MISSTSNAQVKAVAALVKKVEWKPIYHTGSRQSLGKAA